MWSRGGASSVPAGRFGASVKPMPDVQFFAHVWKANREAGARSELQCLQNLLLRCVMSSETHLWVVVVTNLTRIFLHLPAFSPARHLKPTA